MRPPRKELLCDYPKIIETYVWLSRHLQIFIYENKVLPVEGSNEDVVKYRW